MRPLGILETALYVTDLNRAEEFYTRTFGLEVKVKEEGRNVFLKCGNSMLLLFNPDSTSMQTGLAPAHGAKGPGHVAFSIEPGSFETWKEHLNKNGISIETEVEWPKGGRSLYLRDPSNNSVELTTPEIWQ